MLKTKGPSFLLRVGDAGGVIVDMMGWYDVKDRD